MSGLCVNFQVKLQPSQGKFSSLRSHCVAFGAVGAGRLNMEPIASMYVACVSVCVFTAALKAELLHLCSPPLSFLVKFFSFRALYSAKAGRFKMDCASDGSRGMLCSGLRLYALKHSWPRLLFWRFACKSCSTQSGEGLDSQAGCRSALRTFCKGCKTKCFYGCNCRPYAKKYIQSQCLTGKQSS